MKKLKVHFNGQVIDETSDFEYSVTLKEGINTIILDPSDVHPDLESQTYEIAYYAPANGLEVRTDLRDGWESKSPSFSFLAYALSDQGKAQLTVKLEDKTVKAGANNYYRVTLAEGENLIHLKATDGIENLSYSFSIYYNPVGKDEPPENGDDNNNQKPDEGNDDEDPEKVPLLRTTLVEGQTIIGKDKSFNAWATDYKGNALGSDYVLVKLNGSRKNASLFAEKDGKLTYRLKLAEGTNKITFTVVDDEGNMAQYQYVVNCEYPKDGEPIGKISLTVLVPSGIGYIIPPSKVDIYEGDTACTVLLRTLEENGYTCIYEGTEESFYFVGVGNLGGVGMDSICAGDYGSMSGWLYAWNGEYPNFGMGAALLQDGDDIFIRYTIDGR